MPTRPPRACWRRTPNATAGEITAGDILQTPDGFVCVGTVETTDTGRIVVTVARPGSPAASVPMLFYAPGTPVHIALRGQLAAWRHFTGPADLWRRRLPGGAVLTAIEVSGGGWRWSLDTPAGAGYRRDAAGTAATVDEAKAAADHAAGIGGGPR